MTGRFAPGFGATIFALACVPVCVALGIWQLDRAAEKRLLLQSRAARLEQAPLEADRASLGAADAGELLGRRIGLHGRYDGKRLIFLDNQTRAGVPGYAVLSPFVLADESAAVLVNRGWVQAAADRRILPEIPTPEGALVLAGVVRAPRGVGYDFDRGAIEVLGGGRYRVLATDIESLRRELRLPLAPLVVELANDAAGALAPLPPDAPLGPERHVAYAVQWFGIALAGAVVYAVHGFRAARVGTPS
jgi:surfeit locus 1 family protein